MGVRADLSRAPSDTWGVRPCPPRLTKMPDNPEIWKAAAMADQFDKMQKLPDPLPGAPNFHRIPGYKVYMCGQPTLEGIKNALEKVTGTIYPKDGQIIWLNLRQEPDVYVNGQPICARPPNKIGEYAELGAVTRDIIKADEAEFFKVVEGRVKENIAESKLSYEIMDDAAQAFLKVKIMDNIHKYYYLIVFTTYMREMAEVA